MPSLRDIKKRNDKNKQVLAPNELTAFLGDSNGTVKADDEGHVYVILNNGVVLTVHNERVPLIPRTPVICGYDPQKPKLLQVLRARDVYVGSPVINVPNHADHHTWPNVDVAWIRGEQFLPGAAIPAGGLTVQLVSFVYFADSAFHILNNTTLDLTSDVPTDGAKYILVEIDSAGTIYKTAGSAKDSRELLVYEDIPAPTTARVPLVAIKVYAGQSTVLLSAYDTDIADLRWSKWSEGTGGGGYTPPVTDAVNDFQVGDGLGSWVKNTIAQVITSLRAFLDDVYVLAGSSYDFETLNSEIERNKLRIAKLEMTIDLFTGTTTDELISDGEAYEYIDKGDIK